MLDKTNYKSLQSDPTSKHLALVDSWCSEWLGKGEISPEVAKWVLNKEARPGVCQISDYRDTILS